MNPETLDVCRQTAEAVLENMFFETLTGPPSPYPDCPPEALRAEARFSGSEQGSLQMAADEVVARRLASNFLGEDETKVYSQDVEDTLCELANICCGCLLSQLRPGAHLKIASPAILTGNSGGREWVQLPVEAGLLAMSLQWDDRPE